MGKVCPWCLEPLRIAERKAARCPHCDRPFHDEEGRELRPLDLRYEQVVERQQDRFLQMLMVGIPVVLVLALGLSTLHVGAVAAAPLVVVVHLIVVRVWLVRDARRLLGATRRSFVRWLSRLSFLWLGIPGYGLAAAPLVGLAPAVVTFTGLTAAVHAYSSWSLGRERQRAPLAGWERALLWGLAAVTVLTVVIVAALLALVGWSATAVIDWVRSR
ncbi:MAG TPA: hypothetical protein PKJ99_06085 [Thermoanaerobaculales bacterium]|nr:hypothetical protein [Thermoanaerobaculales bacterium]HPA80095.1 hypothetical protein [Thermoanaerobaculales bacterium]HQL29625.1 hypothetical protein [Thermoanaerobaculales bacterium]HQN95583.1 hypothetical protein [Thermoanaerobaculales bacterium]HQP44038.1 hypothetical protein [Thermoanaerobaculales bacterium]